MRLEVWKKNKCLGTILVRSKEFQGKGRYFYSYSSKGHLIGYDYHPIKDTGKIISLKRFFNLSSHQSDEISVKEWNQIKKNYNFIPFKK